MIRHQVRELEGGIQDGTAYTGKRHASALKVKPKKRIGKLPDGQNRWNERDGTMRRPVTDTNSECDEVN